MKATMMWNAVIALHGERAEVRGAEEAVTDTIVKGLKKFNAECCSAQDDNYVSWGFGDDNYLWILFSKNLERLGAAAREVFSDVADVIGTFDLS